MYTPTRCWTPIYRIVQIVSLFLALASGLALSSARANAASRAPESATATAATPLASMLDAEGWLNLPPGFSGSLDPQGWKLASGEGEAPRFVPEVVGDEKWVAGFGPNGVSGDVSALVADGSGNIYVGGDFGAAGGVPANHIAKWNGTSWSALGYGLDQYVSALAWDSTNSVLYAAGGFKFLCASANCNEPPYEVNHVARWDGSNWTGLGSGVDSGAYALAVDGSGSVYVGGSFTGTCTTPACGGTNPVNHIAKWTPGGWFGSWSALGSGANVGADSSVFALAWDGTNDVLYVGGSFTHVANTSISANRIALFNPIGSIWAPLNFGGKYGVDGNVYALAWDSTNDWLYVGGTFDHWCESSACSSPVAQVNYLARWDTAGVLGWSYVDHGVNGAVFALELAGSDVYVGGAIAGWCPDIACASWSPARGIVKWASSGPGSWSALGSGIHDGIVKAVALSSSNVYVGGSFSVAGGTFATGIAAWNKTSGNWSALAMGGNGVSSGVQALAADGQGHVYVGGVFTSVGNTIANKIAKWNGSGWSALGYGLYGNVQALVIDMGGSLYAGGEFLAICLNADCNSMTPVNGVVKWTPSGGSGSWGPVGKGLKGDVHALAFDQAGKLYAGGHFDSLCTDAACSSTTPANHVAKWDGTTWTAVGKGLDDGVFALAVGKNNVLYAGGIFTRLCADLAGCSPSTQVNHVAQWDGNAWSGIGNGMDGSVIALAVDKNNRLYSGGSFIHVCATAGCAPGDSASRIAQWDGTKWSGVGNGMNGPVNALAVDGRNHLFAGGTFTGLCPIAPCLVQASRIAEWDGSSWSALGSGIGPGSDGTVASLAVGFGSVYAGGHFSTAGDKISANFAQYRYGAFLALPLVMR